MLVSMLDRQHGLPGLPRELIISEWRLTTKGTLKRTYRVRLPDERRRILKEIASVLSQDHFVGASTHKVNSSLRTDHVFSPALLYILCGM